MFGHILDRCMSPAIHRTHGTKVNLTIQSLQPLLPTRHPARSGFTGGVYAAHCQGVLQALEQHRGYSTSIWVTQGQLPKFTPPVALKIGEKEKGVCFLMTDKKTQVVTEIVCYNKDQLVEGAVLDRRLATLRGTQGRPESVRKHGPAKDMVVILGCAIKKPVLEKALAAYSEIISFSYQRTKAKTTVEYSKQESVERLMEVAGQEGFLVGGRLLTVQRVRRKLSVSVTGIFPPLSDSFVIRRSFAPFGHILSVHLTRNGTEATVNFAQYEDLQLCLKSAAENGGGVVIGTMIAKVSLYTEPADRHCGPLLTVEGCLLGALLQRCSDEGVAQAYSQTLYMSMRGLVQVWNQWEKEPLMRKVFHAIEKQMVQGRRNRLFATLLRRCLSSGVLQGYHAQVKETLRLLRHLHLVTEKEFQDAEKICGQIGIHLVRMLPEERRGHGSQGGLPHAPRLQAFPNLRVAPSPHLSMAPQKETLPKTDLRATATEVCISSGSPQSISMLSEGHHHIAADCMSPTIHRLKSADEQVVPTHMPLKASELSAKITTSHMERENDFIRVLAYGDQDTMSDTPSPREVISLLIQSAVASLFRPQWTRNVLPTTSLASNPEQPLPQVPRRLFPLLLLRCQSPEVLRTHWASVEATCRSLGLEPPARVPLPIITSKYAHFHRHHIAEEDDFAPKGIRKKSKRGLFTALLKRCLSPDIFVELEDILQPLLQQFKKQKDIPPELLEKVLCVYGVDCSNPRCAQSHPRGRSQPPCHNGHNCANHSCTFYHLPVWTELEAYEAKSPRSPLLGYVPLSHLTGIYLCLRPHGRHVICSIAS